MVTEAGYESDPGYDYDPYQSPEDMDLNPDVMGGAWAHERDLTGRQQLDRRAIDQPDVEMSTQPGNEPRIDLSVQPESTAQEPTQIGTCAATPAELLAIEAMHLDDMSKQKVKTYAAAAVAFVGGWIVARYI